MERPWMKFGTRDWLDNKELRRCSAAARGILADLMCLAHEGHPYGHLADKVGPLTVQYMASRCIVSSNAFLKAIAELEEHGRLSRTEEKVLFIPRMVEDERVRLARAAGGSKSVEHPNTHKARVLTRVPFEGTLTPTLVSQIEGGGHSRARTRADSDSLVSSPGVLLISSPEKEAPDSVAAMKTRFEEWIGPWPRVPSLDKAMHAWAFCWTPEEDTAIFACRDRYLTSKDVAEGVCQNPDRFLNEQKVGGWAGKWPSARDPPAHQQAAKTSRVKEIIDSL